MVRSLLIFLLLSASAQGDIFDLTSESIENESRLPSLIDKLKKIEVSDGPAYESIFNQTVKAIENRVEEEKLFCSGEAQDSEGKTLPASQKQLCMRELKKHYLEATSTILDLKKKYLGHIHRKQLENLTEIQNKLKADIEKNF
jgi:hypothetical protein